jgi:hypothetical protein
VPDFVPRSMLLNKKNVFAGQTLFTKVWKTMASLVNIASLLMTGFDSATSFSKNVSGKDVVRFLS